MSSMRFNLLEEPLLSIVDGTAELQVTLPEALTRLVRGGLDAFSALQPHQAHAWHVFLVQLAAIGQTECGLATPPDEASGWREVLKTLAGGYEEPWCLVVPDATRPAFLQPAIPGGRVCELRNRITTPDDLDVLITAKNHDIKAKRMVRSRPEHWVYALMSLQTTQGFLGAGNYGIARMNGGFGSRPLVGLAPGFGWSERFQRDLAVLIDGAGGLADAYGYRTRGGHALLWLVPWDGTTQLAMDACHPYFIEICRRVRLAYEAGQFTAHAGTSKAARLAAKDLKGNSGDPWTPVHREKATSLTVGPSGLSYALVQSLLFGNDYRSGAALELRPADGEGTLFRAAVLARGQGETNGLHERTLPLPKKARLALGSAQAQGRLATLARNRVEAAAVMERKVLRPALLALFDSSAVSRFQAHADAEVDQIFFECLWRDMDLDLEHAESAWQRELLAIGQRELRRAEAQLPVPLARRFRALSQAENRFWAEARKHLPFAFDKEKSHAAD